MASKQVTYFIVAALGGLASLFGIIGAFNGVKDGNGTVRYAPDYSYCTWPSSPAAALGIAGFFLILAAQITSNASGGCVFFIAKQSPLMGTDGKACAILCLLFSWILTFTAAILLLVGGIANSGAAHMKLDADGLTCHYPSTSLLLTGGIVSVIDTGLALLFFHIVAGSSLSNVHTVAHAPSEALQMPTVTN